MIKTILLSLVMSQSTFAQEFVQSSEYTYPNFQPLQSTIATSSIGVPNATWTKIKFQPKNRFVNGKKASIKIRYYKAKQECTGNKNPSSNKLVFLLSGLGGEANGGQANFYAEAMTKRCLSVLILPSIFTKDFTQAVSSSGVVGDFINDTADFYDLMVYSRDFVEKTNGIQFQSYSVMGYSLGGLTTAFVSELDSRRKEFNFTTSLIINTPVDLLHGMRTLDAYADQSRKIGRFRMIKILLSWGKNLLTHTRYKTGVTNYSTFISKMEHLRDSEKELIIGKVLMGSLPDVVKASKKTLLSIDQQGFADVTSYTPGARSPRSSFVNYMENYVLKFLRAKGEESLTIAELNARNSLASVEDHLRSNQNIYMMHNIDDFLLKQGDVEYMANVFGNRFTLYPRGGHVGNLWYKDNLQKMLNIVE